MPSTNSPTAAAKLPTNTHALLTDVTSKIAVVKADTTHFPNSSQYIPAMEAHRDTLASCLNGAQGTGTIAAAALKKAVKRVKKDMRQLTMFVQGAADLLPPAEAAALIVAMLMYVSKVGQRPPKAALALRRGAVSGEVLLIARAVEGATAYYWQVSGDNQKTWSSLPDTTKTRTTATGLTLGQAYYFRCAALTRTGRTDYTQVVGMIVV